MTVDTKNSVFWKSTYYLFLLFFVTFPFANYSGFLYSGTSTRSLNLVIFSAVLGIDFAVWLFKKGNTVSIAKSPLVIALTLYLASLTLSGLVGLNLSTTFWSVATRMTGIWYFLSLGFFMFLLWAFVNDEKKHHTLILGIILSTALYSVLDLFGNDGFGWLFKGSLNEAFTFGNTTFAAMYIFGAFLLSLYYLLQAEQKKWWMYLLPIVLVINPNIINPHVWSGDFSSGIVGAAQATSYVIVLSLFALGLLWFISKIRDARRRTQASYTLFGIGVLVAFLASFSLLSPNGYLREAYLNRSTAARPLVWQMAERAIGERPALGFGADNFERVFERF